MTLLYCPNDRCPFLAQTGSRSSFQNRVTHCLDCGSELTETPPPLPQERPLGPIETLDEWVTVACFESLEDAEVIANKLISEQIPAALDGRGAEELPEQESTLPYEIEVQVRASDAARAFHLVHSEIATAGLHAMLAESPACEACGAPLALEFPEGEGFEDHPPAEDELAEVPARLCPRCAEKLGS